MLTGGCFCGFVRYEADAHPFHETVCHCASCRRMVGAAEVAWFSVPRAAFRLTAGAPSRFASSEGVERSFCPTCGTSLTYRSRDFPDEIDVTIASLDDPDAAPPRDHTQVADKLRWTRLPEDLPAYPTRRPGR